MVVTPIPPTAKKTDMTQLESLPPEVLELVLQELTVIELHEYVKTLNKGFRNLIESCTNGRLGKALFRSGKHLPATNALPPAIQAEEDVSTRTNTGDGGDDTAAAGLDSDIDMTADTDDSDSGLFTPRTRRKKKNERMKQINLDVHPAIKNLCLVEDKSTCPDACTEMSMDRIGFLHTSSNRRSSAFVSVQSVRVARDDATSPPRGQINLWYGRGEPLVVVHGKGGGSVTVLDVAKAVCDLVRRNSDVWTGFCAPLPYQRRNTVKLRRFIDFGMGRLSEDPYSCAIYMD